MVAPAVGKMIADAIGGGAAPPWAQAVRASRFSGVLTDAEAQVI
jgi:glycine/D-amino acid oxidase-like deaminating enzyme